MISQALYILKNTRQISRYSITKVGVEEIH